MSESVKPLAKPVFVQKYRPPQENIPLERGQREHLWAVAQQYVKQNDIVFPIPIPELREHSFKVIELANAEAKHVDFTAVLVNNAACVDILAGIPFHKRLLLLPKCLRKEETCKAKFDEFGLLCKFCGMCSIQDLITEAENLGYAVLVAEGSPIVMSIIETGKIEAIVGVSCLAVLERVFPYMEAAAVPGLAVPLLQDDCLNTTVDMEWVWDVIHLTSEDKTYRLDLEGLKSQVSSWFELESLQKILGKYETETEEIAYKWLAKTGKRWRPFLTVCAYQSLQEASEEVLDNLSKLAVAVECFHKASLIHDDIEDQDSLRYGEKTLHEEYGVAVALNVGDYLLAEGYRLIGECAASPEQKVQMLQIAIQGHRQLTIGQGTELCWTTNPTPLRAAEVVDIFRKKTAPAFEVALKLGAIYGGADEEILGILSQYSESLGIAYQIRDDLDDIQGESNDCMAMRPSLILSLAYQKASKENKLIFEQLWKSPENKTQELSKVLEVIQKTESVERAEQLAESYKEEAIQILRRLKSPSLKGLLRRVIGKIFNDLKIEGWCSEFASRNAASGQTSPQAAASSTESSH